MKDILMECFPLYRNDQKVFTGYDDENGKNVIGFYNIAKINPKEPDLRLYYSDKGRREEKEFLSLWLKKSVNDRPYLIGNKNGFCYIGLIHFNRVSESDPYMTIYLVMKINKECNKWAV